MLGSVVGLELLLAAGYVLRFLGGIRPAWARIVPGIAAIDAILAFALRLFMPSFPGIFGLPFGALQNALAVALILLIPLGFLSIMLSGAFQNDTSN
ncbi:MAG: hypothetical protein OJF49_001468 [Ktedonobacterales bacterium]|nr:MAG: hypothetical protein OJF49_001468 [Ktedonobacterales bacterium]